MSPLRLLLLLSIAALSPVARAQEPTFRPDIEGPWEVDSSSGIDGVFFKIPVVRGAPSWRTIDVWVYHRSRDKETSGGYFPSDSLEISDPAFARLRIHFVHASVPSVGAPGSFDLDVIFSPNEQHWAGTWSRDGEHSQVVLERPHPASGVAPSTFVGDWQAEPDPNSRFPREQGSLHIFQSSDGVLTPWLDRRDYGNGERLYVRSAMQNTISLETASPFGSGYQFQGSLSSDRQVLTGVWVMMAQPENRGASLNAPTRFRRKP